jgi:hypothetical protein
MNSMRHDERVLGTGLFDQARKYCGNWYLH